MPDGMATGGLWRHATAVTPRVAVSAIATSTVSAWLPVSRQAIQCDTSGADRVAGGTVSVAVDRLPDAAGLGRGSGWRICVSLVQQLSNLRLEMVRDDLVAWLAPVQPVSRVPIRALGGSRYAGAGDDLGETRDGCPAASEIDSEGVQA